MTDAEKWEERYRQPGYRAGAEPASFLRQVLPLLPRGAALDLAMGTGRNAVFLAGQGWRVTGLDRSAAALEKAAALAAERGVAAQRADAPGGVSQHPGLLLLEADLESCKLPEGPFDVLLCFRYLQRSLFPAMERILRLGGLLVFETCTLDQLNYPEGPRNPEHLLRPGELREAFPRLDTLYYAETNAGRGVASLLAQRKK